MAEWHSEISEWWDHEGHWHEGAPSDEQLLDEAIQVTGHLWNDSGDNLFFTSFSDDGWTPEEWEQDIEDAGDYYAPSS